MHVYHSFIRCSAGGRFGCFHVLAIVNSAAMDTGVCVSFQIMVFSGYMRRSGIPGSHISSIFSILKGPPSCSPYGCTNLHSHQQCRRVPLSPHPFPHLLSRDFLVEDILKSGYNVSLFLFCFHMPP